MTNKVVISLFILFALIVFLSSLQTVSQTHQAASKPNFPATKQPAAMPSFAPTPTMLPTKIPIQIQHPGYRVNVGGEAGDD